MGTMCYFQSCVLKHNLHVRQFGTSNLPSHTTDDQCVNTSSVA